MTISTVRSNPPNLVLDELAGPGAVPPVGRNTDSAAAMTPRSGPQVRDLQAALQESAIPSAMRLAASDAASLRSRRTPPPPATIRPDVGQTFNAYDGPATKHDRITMRVLSRAAGKPDALRNTCCGLVYSNFYMVATGKAPNLFDMNALMRESLADPRLRPTALAAIRQVHRDTQNVAVADTPGYIARRGSWSIRTGPQLRDSLESEFGQRHSSADGRGSYETTMMPVRMTFRAPSVSEQDSSATCGHVIIVQRLNPSDHYRNDRYQIYDPAFGAFEYANFEQMAAAMNSLLAEGYPALGGIARLSVFPSDAENTYRSNDGTSAPPSPLGNVSLGSLGEGPELQGAHSLMLPPVDLPAPDVAQPPRSPHGDLKRDVSAEPDRQPYVLYRPSNRTPDEMRKDLGFSLEGTRLNNVSLDLHNFALAADPGVTDGGGYLGTFRDSETAKNRLSSREQSGGYLYYIAPSPNMVDVHASLGRSDRSPTSDEVAAMGRIKLAQVRGWSKFENGKLGPYVTNPDYRYDIFDHTRTGGAQPQLAHFSPDDPAWNDDDHKPFVAQKSAGGNTRYVPNEDPALTTAEFYRRSLDKVDYLADQLAKGEDYHEPVHIKPYFNNDDGKGNTKLNFYNGNAYPSVDSASSVNSQYEFSFGDDGRIHSSHDDRQVLRIDGSGNAYIGSVPEDRASMNGVFVYDPDSGGLLHVEDHKWLTEGVASYRPYVASPQARNGQLAARQSWRLENNKGQAVYPPLPMAVFKDNPVATSQQQYQLYQDPDSALPTGSTHFVTEVPGIANPGGAQAFMQSQPPVRDVAHLSNWLTARNAAWLFRDGLIATPAASGQLEIRTIGGTPIWRTSVDPVSHQLRYESLQARALTSNFEIPEPIWMRIIAQQTRYTDLENRASHVYM